MLNKEYADLIKLRLLPSESEACRKHLDQSPLPPADQVLTFYETINIMMVQPEK